LTTRPRKENKATPHPIDVQVGNRLRQRRVALGLTQEKLAQAIGITFQQIQKYERGMNRIVASRLFELAGVLKIDVGYFFLDRPQGRDPASPAGKRQTQEQAGQQRPDRCDDHLAEWIAERETLALVRAYHQIANPAVRRQIVDLMKSLGTPP
tara:strand:+ start:1057 stop:1515 length:459 start_codon:yes stop_codon:yes gene_type:complete